MARWWCVCVGGREVVTKSVGTPGYEFGFMARAKGVS